MGAEGIIVIDAQDSPNGQHLLLLANEVSSTLSIYQMNSCAVASGAIITAPTNQICVGASLNLNVATQANVTYQWLFNNQVITGATTNTINANAAGVYKVAVQNSTLGCMDTSAVFNLTANPLPLVDAGQDITVCSGAVVNLAATGNATTYVWNNGQSGTSLVINTQGFAGNNTYSVLATNTTTGCQAQDAVQVTVNALPLVDAGPDLIICLGDSILLNASGAQTYNWNNNYTNGAYITPGAGLSNLVVSGVNSLGCTANDSLEIQVNALPGISITPGLSVCASNLPVNLEVNATGAVLWNTNETTNSISAGSAGIYSATVTDLLTGCQNQATTELQVWQNPIIDLDSAYGVCSANLPYTINALGQGSNLTYMWSNGQTTPTLNGSQQGVFTLAVIDVNGCQASAQTQVEILNSPNVNAGEDQVVCENQFPVTLAASGSANAILWNTGSSAALLSVSSPGVYVLTGTNTNGCSAQDTVEITSDPCLAIESQELRFSVYPNPVSESLFLNVSELPKNLALYSTEGKLMLQINALSDFVEIDMRLLASGVYILEITLDSGIYTQRIVKQ